MKKHVILGLIAVVAAGFVCAQTPADFALKLETTDTAGKTEVVVVGSWKVDNIQGWSWGVCHKAAEASIGDCAGQTQPAPNPCTGGCAAKECPADMQTPGPTDQTAAFHSLNIFEGGMTQGIVLDFMQTWDLDTTDRFELMKIRYTLKGGTKKSRLDFCNTLGTPPVDVTFVVNGSSFQPATQQGVEIGEDGECTLALGIKFGTPTVTGTAGSQEASIPVLLTTGATDAVSGFQFGAKLDKGTVRIDPLKVAQGQAIHDAMGGGNADFFGVNAVTNGVTVGCVLDLEPEGEPPVFRTLPVCTADQEIAVIIVQCNSTAGPVTANLAFSGTLGTPAVPIVVDVDGTSLTPTIGADASFTVDCTGVSPGKKFVRGDANQDGARNVSDGVAIAKAVFGVGSKFTLIENCKDSADANDDGRLNTSDAVYLLQYLFTGGAAIPAPSTCGTDPTLDDLTCDEYPGCPQQ